MALPNGNMEIVFSFDTTGSMCSCLDEVRGRVSDMVQRLQADIPGIKMAIFAHGDYCDKSTYVTKYVDLTDDVTKLVDFVQNVEGTGGGDADECYELVLHEVRTKLSWSPGTQRALVMIGDCNPHEPNYPQNKLKLNWRTEADELAAIGVRIYSVHCSKNNADKFYKDIAKRTGGQYLNLCDFKNVFDFLMAVCYREKGDDMFSAYEKEVRGRGGAMHKDLDTLFGNLRDTDVPATSSVSTGMPIKIAPKAARKPSKLTKVPSLTKAKLSVVPRDTKTSPKRVRKPRSKTVHSKYAEKNLPKLRRENVPECNFMLREMKWSSWQHVISPKINDGHNITLPRKGTGNGFRTSTIFGGKTKVTALYEVAVQTTYRARKFVLFCKLCRQGFPAAGNWERRLMGRSDIRSQIDKVVEKNCNVFIRRVVLTNRKTSENVRTSLKRYDYAWKPIKPDRTGHRVVTKAHVDISEKMEI